MNLSSSKNSQLILLVILIAALIFAAYYYVVMPKREQVDSLNRSIDSLNTEISSIQATITQTQAEQSKETTNVFTIEKKLPSSREVDELLLNIEEIEYVTDSLVLSIAFNGYDSSVADAGIGLQNEDAAATDSNAPTDPNAAPNTTDPNATSDPNNGVQNTEGQTVNAGTSPEPGLAMNLPPELKMISFSLEIESPDYNHLMQFIDEIENLERIMKVDSINFSLPGEEVNFQEDVPESITASIQVTTFYYEGQ
nr:potassium transporter [Lysinibacillus timonensis]